MENEWLDPVLAVRKSDHCASRCFEARGQRGVKPREVRPRRKAFGTNFGDVALNSYCQLELQRASAQMPQIDSRELCGSRTADRGGG